MKTIVITGSTRGIGFGLADAFLARGCQVMVSGRSTETVAQAAAELGQKHGSEKIAGQACDVSDYAQVQALWDAAAARFSGIDIWINNAGLGNTLTPFWELSPEKMRQVVDTNVLGAMYGSSVALRGMLRQGHGSLYNMEGYGSRDTGRMVSGLTLYGTTKAALAFLDRSLAEEVKGTPVIFGALLPGMVVTDLLLNQRQGDPAQWERAKRAFNILADRVETVTPWLADQVLANQKNGVRISWISGAKIMLRFLAAPFTRRNVID
jgi:NAD(P)-dependent dehydrogenase (short-subunit alcohol dehydrogenase family)